MFNGNQTIEEIYSLIRQAILAKDILAVSYRGSVREMCPHVLGKTIRITIRTDVSIRRRKQRRFEAGRIPRELALPPYRGTFWCGCKKIGWGMAHGIELFSYAELRSRN